MRPLGGTKSKSNQNLNIFLGPTQRELFGLLSLEFRSFRVQSSLSFCSPSVSLDSNYSNSIPYSKTPSAVTVTTKSSLIEQRALQYLHYHILDYHERAEMSEKRHLLARADRGADLELTAALHEATLDDIYIYFESSRWGLTSDEARRSRASHGLNNIPPPIAAPAWLCCLLPCLLKTKSMEQYHECVPEYAFVMRNKRWVKMDSASIVPGDVIRVEAGGQYQGVQAMIILFELSGLVISLLLPLNQIKSDR